MQKHRQRILLLLLMTAFKKDARLVKFVSKKKRKKFQH